jgi:hypothetical protein
MGPAYFPVLLGGLLAVLGAAVLLGSLVIDGPGVDRVQLPPAATDRRGQPRVRLR